MKPKTKKPPRDIPVRMQYCRLRADAETFGVLLRFDPESEWATVEWLSEKKGPKIVHRYELQREDTIEGVVHGCFPFVVRHSQIEDALKALPDSAPEATGKR